MTSKERGNVIALWWELATGLDDDALAARIATAIDEAVKEEREACATLAEQEYDLNCGQHRGLPEIHTAIRARSKP